MSGKVGGNIQNRNPRIPPTRPRVNPLSLRGIRKPVVPTDQKSATPLSLHKRVDPLSARDHAKVLNRNQVSSRNRYKVMDLSMAQNLERIDRIMNEFKADRDAYVSAKALHKQMALKCEEIARLQKELNTKKVEVNHYREDANALRKKLNKLKALINV